LKTTKIRNFKMGEAAPKAMVSQTAFQKGHGGAKKPVSRLATAKVTVLMVSVRLDSELSTFRS